MGLHDFQKGINRGEKVRPPRTYNNTPWQLKTFRIDVDESAVLRVVDPGDDGFYVRGQHWLGGPCTCTAQMEGFDGRCVYCFLREEARKVSEESRNNDEKRDADLYVALRYCVEVIDFRYYHIVPKGDKQDVQRCGSDEALPGRNRCRLCASPDPKQAERHFGGHKIWEMPDGQYRQLGGVHNKLSSICLSGEGSEVCGKQIFPVGFSCQACSHELISERDLNTWNDDQINEAVSSVHKCPECEFEDFAKEDITCDNGQHDASRGSLYYKRVEVACSGKVTKDKRGEERKTKTLNFDTSFKFSHIVEDVMEYGFTEEEATELAKPWDVSARFRPEWVKPKDYDDVDQYVAAVLKAQAKRCKRPNPYVTQSASRSKPFGFKR